MRKEDVLVNQIVTYINAAYPKVIYHFDLGSGATKSIGMAMRDKRINRHRGYPDLFICEAKGGFHGLFLELKTEGTKIYLKDNKTLVSDKHIREQSAFHELLRARGYAAYFAEGFYLAKHHIDKYLLHP